MAGEAGFLTRAPSLSCSQAHQCARALEVYKQAEAMVVSTQGADSAAACLARRKLAGAHMTLGELQQGEKEYAPAREQYEAALAMLEKVTSRLRITRGDREWPLNEAQRSHSRGVRVALGTDYNWVRGIGQRRRELISHPNASRPMNSHPNKPLYPAPLTLSSLTAGDGRRCSARRRRR